MTTRYVDGTNGNNSWSGLSPVYTGGTTGPKATINGAEDTPVAAGDLVWVRPGTYREQHVCDVSGVTGSSITFVGDVSGQIWGVGGIVRVTGSDDDITNTRASCVESTSISFRMFRGFYFDGTTDNLIGNAGGIGWVVEDCFLSGHGQVASLITFSGACTNSTIRRCLFLHSRNTCVYLFNASTINDQNILVENCVFLGGANQLYVSRVGGATIRNCTHLFTTAGAERVGIALAVGQTLTSYNNIVSHCQNGFMATTTAEFTENFNSIWGNQTDYTNVTAGANTITRPPLFNGPTLLDGFRFPWMVAELGSWSTLYQVTGSNASTEDFFGITRPTTESKKSRGAIQSTRAVRDATIFYDGVTGSSLRLPDAGEQFLMHVPTNDTSTTFALKAYWGGGYGGINPQMILRQPGQSDVIVTGTGAALTWNTLNSIITPAAMPLYTDVFVKSLNTSSTGSFAAYFDALTVT